MRSLLLLTFVLFNTWVNATPTKLVVRAKAKDAKFIGSSIGGALVVVRKSATGELLAEGMTEGSTGNTSLIMKDPQERYKSIVDDNTAKFEVVLDITEPVFVNIEVTAPFNQPQSSIVASTQLWLIPGKDIDGEGVVLEIPGFIVNVLTPQTHESLSGKKTTISANIVMMCGCPLTNGGLWDAEKIEVRAMIKEEGKVLTELPLHVKEKANTFEEEFSFSDSGNYEIVIYAYDQRTGNTGVGKVNFKVNN
ncbi:hypothetical protein LVD15_14285 [Fulvivirga maritima]|uniref:hypothetical protein n=1 Tax=Fulvivirga maritima TaxID=2904247 RepID=UPI001F24D45B|nr:hypothetical protein [Fulvivirga maritima]UII24491.1 hypothetical protein LVD15_14285 [Fulvivirga maritima]